MGPIDLAVGLGASVVVHGSPKQRAPRAVERAADAVARLPEFFASLAAFARAAGLTYRIEPLSGAEAEVTDTVEEGAALAGAIGDPAFATMIDTSAAGLTEPPVDRSIGSWLPTGRVGHIHLDDTNRGAPGTGSDPFDRDPARAAPRRLDGTDGDLILRAGRNGARGLRAGNRDGEGGLGGGALA